MKKILIGAIRVIIYTLFNYLCAWIITDNNIWLEYKDIIIVGAMFTAFIESDMRFLFKDLDKNIDKSKSDLGNYYTKTEIDYKIDKKL